MVGWILKCARFAQKTGERRNPRYALPRCSLYVCQASAVDETENNPCKLIERHQIMRKASSDCAGPVMVIAPLHRSGSTYLHDILALHPDLESHAVNEDYLMSAAHHLEAFSAAVRHNWARRRSNRHILDGFVDELMPAFGAALSQLLDESSTGTRVLLKTPVVSNLHLLPVLFQRCSNRSNRPRRARSCCLWDEVLRLEI